MIGRKVESEEDVSLTEVKRILDERKKDKELTYEQQLSYDHAKKFAALDKAQEDKLTKAMVEFEISPRAAMKIMDVLPKNPNTLRQILIKENRTFSDEDITKILASIKAAAK